MTAPPWLTVRPGRRPLLISIPHAGVAIPPAIERRLISPWRARKDADWWVRELYGFAEALGASLVTTALSRTVIDVNRDPSGTSLYPGQATTGLCPLETFDGEAIYQPGEEPSEAEIAERRAAYFDPYHMALEKELERLRSSHGRAVLFEAHSIRSVVPRLFEGQLAQFNLGTNQGQSCAPALSRRLVELCRASGTSWVLDGRFKGGWITRRWGRPAEGIHAVQMELACRGYMDEPPAFHEDSWPTPFVRERAAPLQADLARLLHACLAFASEPEEIP
jgi:formiminoglutamase